MELIATARFKKAMDRASAATAYTDQITKLVGDLTKAGLEVSHPLLEKRDTTNKSILLVLTANRGLCGGYNGNVVRQAVALLGQWKSEQVATQVSVSGKRGISAMRFRNVSMEETYTTFEDKPEFAEVAPIGEAYLSAYASGAIDRLDVVYTRFHGIAKQEAVSEMLLPLAPPQAAGETATKLASDEYDFYPSAASILQEILPASFMARLFKCFLDAAVSEQVARMVAMKAATENAGGLIKSLSRQYNRARQSQITGEIMEILGGVEALKQ